MSFAYASANAIAIAFAVVVLAASARLLWRFFRTDAARRPRGWRVAALLLAQALGACLLYRTLFPPQERGEAGVLVVATAGADRAQRADRPSAAQVVALPEAPVLADARRLPDLATALRLHPGTTRIRVLGAGLAARDLDAARGHALEFVPAPLPRGLVALWPPRRVQAGRRFAVAGRANGLRGGSVELLDPAGAIAARAVLPADGAFRLGADAVGAGLAQWRLRLRDGRKAVVEDVALPLDVAAGAPLRVLLLAGAPNAELKYLRRWASDAGLSPEARIELGAGMRIGDAPAALDTATLARQDLVVLDQRSWDTLGGARRAALLAAVHDGLGLLLQLPYATAAGERATLRRLGFGAEAAGPAREVALPATSAATTATGDAAASANAAPKADAAPTPKLVRGPLRIAGDDTVVLLRDAGGAPLAGWRAHGAGRIGVATFDESWRLALAGREDLHGGLWSTLFSTLARPRGGALPTIDGDARVGERVVACGLRPGAQVVAPDGRRSRLLVDPASGVRACAGFWPRQPGWHLLQEPASTQAGDARAIHFPARGADEAPGLRAAWLADATRRLAAASASPRAGGDGPLLPGPRWPWFLGWLALAAAGWWFERSRLGAARDARGQA
ncbi:MAG TPA: carboxypeptidase regulatory-like domain-containing protein [Luteimonas sp.]|nr:carboxypeptidase regulatory-like domain-containing protein [Luteimonas sp.]